MRTLFIQKVLRVLNLLSICLLGVDSFVQRSTEISASKGKFMIHMLHSAYFFPQTAEVKWSASAQGKPKLPVWLHLFQSRHRAIAYLVGTPVTPLTQVTIHIIAKRLDNYRTAEQFLTINLNEDVRYNTSVQQLAELRITNVEAEDFINPRDDKIRLLEKAIHETFRGKGVNPYIFNIFSEVKELPENFHRIAHKYKIASIVQIGSQRGFHPNVHKIVEGLNRNPDYCRKKSYIPMDKHFRGKFDIDWCKFEIKNMTMIKTLDEYKSAIIAADARRYESEKSPNAKELQIEKVKSRQAMEEMDVLHKNYPLRTQSFFESVLVFPLLAILCIILVLILSMIFFGRREGQHWRDYKTPKERLQEYLDVRESQRHLREMSVQRQMLFMSDDRGKSQTPVSINTFLRPRYPSVTSSKPHQSPVPNGNAQFTAASQQAHPNGNLLRMPSRGVLSASQPRLPTSASPAPTRHRLERRANSSTVGGSGAELVGYRTPRSSVGKQTVAEAAQATGSSLHLYRNPLDENEDNDDYGADKVDKFGTNNGTLSKRYYPSYDKINGFSTPYYRNRPILNDNYGNPNRNEKYSTVR